MTSISMQLIYYSLLAYPREVSEVGYDKAEKWIINLLFMGRYDRPFDAMIDDRPRH